MTNPHDIIIKPVVTEQSMTEMKRNRNMINSTVNVTNSMNIYLFFFFALAPLKDITLYKVIIIII